MLSGRLIESLRSGDYRRYFIYDEKLKVVVSVVTGAMICLYNTLSGTVIFYVIAELLFGIYDPGILTLIFFILPGMLTGTAILYLSIMLTDLIIGNTSIEDYSYLRLILLVSVILFLLILSFSILILIISGIEKNILKL